MFYLADGLIKVRLQDQYGVVKFTADNLLVIGPSSGGGGGGGSVDPSTVLATGDVKVRYDNAIITGWVRLNGRTIGSASSGASELADPSAQALFQHLWTKDSTLVVSTGRGASAAADWAANKTITLPDCRNRPLVALADMGNTDSGGFTGVTFSKGNSTTLGSTGGAYSKTIATANIPPHQHQVFLKENPHSHTLPGTWVPSGAGGQGGAGAGVGVGITNPPTSSVLTGITVGSVSGTANDNKTDSGSTLGLNGAAMDWSNPFMLITVYIKL
jgi:hypothetical protein